MNYWLIFLLSIFHLTILHFFQPNPPMSIIFFFNNLHFFEKKFFYFSVSKSYHNVRIRWLVIHSFLENVLNFLDFLKLSIDFLIANVFLIYVIIVISISSPFPFRSSRTLNSKIPQNPEFPRLPESLESGTFRGFKIHSP